MLASVSSAEAIAIVHIDPLCSSHSGLRPATATAESGLKAFEFCNGLLNPRSIAHEHTKYCLDPWMNAVTFTTSSSFNLPVASSGANTP